MLEQAEPLLADEPYKNGGSSYVSLNSAVKEAVHVLSYHNVGFTVQKRIFCQEETKTILNRVSGILEGRMNAILGPTGGGKTTLLDILAGRKERNCVSGSVFMNGKPLPTNFKRMSGYVAQEETLIGTLTVREHLQFSAALRLPRSICREEKDARIAEVLAELGLTDVGDTEVGTESKRGISGGERKRVNIGMEIITSPSILFLDEPTTGLDAYTAASVMQLLYKMRRTIIFSIHQPRYAIFKLFDRITLLGKGQTIYHGPANQALNFFEDHGYLCEERENPADFLLDTVQRETEIMEDGTIWLATAYRSSSTFKKIRKTLDAIDDARATVSKEKVKYPTNAIHQFGVLSKRAILNLFRNKSISVAHWIISVVMGLLIGGLYFQITTTDPKQGIQNRVGAFFFIIMNMIFANTSAVELFIKQRPIFKHESLGGHYRTSSYFFAEVLFDIIPYRIIPTTILCSITYWMIGFNSDVEKFLFYVLNLNLTTLAACAIAFLISSLVSAQAVALLMVALIYVFSMLFGGLLINLKGLPKAVSWFKYLSIFRFSLEGLCVNELKGMEFCPDKVKTDGRCHGSDPQNSTGTQYLIDQGYNHSKWTTQIALASIMSFVLLLAYLRLRVMKKTR